jgi:hypothetical protein
MKYSTDAVQMTQDILAMSLKVTVGNTSTVVHPSLAAHVNWDQVQNRLKQSLVSFQKAIRPNKPTARIRKARSFLGLATMTDVGELTAHISTLQAREDKTILVQRFLDKKLNIVKKLMSDFTAHGRVDRAELERGLIHTQLESTAVLMIEAARDAAEELENLTITLLTGWTPPNMLTMYKRGRLLAAAQRSDGGITLTLAIDELSPTLHNCSSTSPLLCTTPTGLFFSPTRDTLNIWAVRSSTSFHKNPMKVIQGEDIGSEKCLEKDLEKNVKITHFCWDSEGHRGTREPPKLIEVSRHTLDIKKFELEMNSIRVPTRHRDEEDVLDFEDADFQLFMGSSTAATVFPAWLSWCMLVIILFMNVLIAGLILVIFKGWTQINTLKEHVATHRTAIGLENAKN